MGKICEMKGVREWSEKETVELWRDEESGRLVIRAYSECGNSIVHVDLWDILDWCRAGPKEQGKGDFGADPTSVTDSPRHGVS